MKKKSQQLRARGGRVLLILPFITVLTAGFVSFHFLNNKEDRVTAASIFTTPTTSASSSSSGADSVLSDKTSKPSSQTATPSPAPAPQPSPAPAVATSKPKAVAPAPAPKVSPAPTTAASGSGDYASEATCPDQTSLTAAQTVLICLSNYARAQHGAGGLSANSALMAAAAAKAQDIINCGFTHTACGHPFDYWIKAKGFVGNCEAENIAEGQATPIDVFTAWMNSSGHRTNILNPSYKYVGEAGVNSPSGVVWVTEFGGC